ncbi:MAG: amidase family protein [Burkholderiaceae bacterium]
MAEPTCEVHTGTCSYLPATAVPVGFTRDGLPVGLQIVGPEMADRRTIWLAGELATLHGGFVAPLLD